MAKILLVDDDREFLEAAKTPLEAKGHEISLTYSVSEAEAEINLNSFDIIFLDIMMEEADDGIALAHKLKKQGLKTPIVMLSAISKVTGYEYGKCDEALPCAGFLEKPISPQQLLNEIESILK